MSQIDLKAAQVPPAVMRTPRTLDIEITSRCNLRCRYCYFFNNTAVDYRDLPAEQWLAFFEELGTLGVMNVTLAGGEPFIREDLAILLDGIVRNRMRFSLLSNGALIDDEIAEFIANTGRCDSVQISVDGASAQVHDTCRGHGAFVGAMHGIEVLRRHRVHVAVRVTIHRQNVHDLDNIAHLLLDELELPGFGTNAAGYLGTCRLHADDVMLTLAERQEAMATLLRLAAQYNDRISATAGPLADGHMWGRMEAARAQGSPAFPNGGRLTGCGCPSKKMAVRADGVMVPCTMLAHCELGLINQDALADVWQHSTVLQQLRHRPSIPLSQFAGCVDCDYQLYCTGNCPGMAYSITGRIDYPSPDACLRTFLAAGGIIA